MIIAVVVGALLVIGAGVWAINRFTGGEPEALPSLSPSPSVSPTEVEPVAPEAQSAPTLSGDAVVGGTITVTEATWDVPVTRFWVWQTCPADAADDDPQGCTNLVGEADGASVTASGSTHVITAAEGGTRLRVVESAIEGTLGSDPDLTGRPVAQTVSAPTEVIAPAPPEPVLVTDVRGQPLSGASDRLALDGLSVVVSYLPDEAADCDPPVQAQAPESGTLPPGSSVVLTVEPPPSRCYLVPEWEFGGGFLELPEIFTDFRPGGL